MSAAAPTRCRLCEAIVDVSDGTMRCPTCQAVLPPSPATSPFARLGVAKRFGHETAALESAWLQRARQVHPDRFAKKPDAERRAAAEQTAALNDAWRVLREPFARAVWLLKDVGVVEPKLPPARLMALMEAREEAEEGAAGKARVVEQTVQKFNALYAEAEAKLRAVDDADAWASTNGELKAIAAQLAELRTLARLAADLGGPTLIASLDGR